MNHSLSVYTVIYLSIIFVTVSIFGSGIGNSGGDIKLLLFAQGVFSLKIAIDDYIHFHKSRKNVYLSLNLSLLIYILLAMSIASSASEKGSLASSLFSLVFLLVAYGFGFQNRPKRKKIAGMVGLRSTCQHFYYFCLRQLWVLKSHIVSPLYQYVL